MYMPCLKMLFDAGKSKADTNHSRAKADFDGYHPRVRQAYDNGASGSELTRLLAQFPNSDKIR